MGKYTATISKLDTAFLAQQIALAQKAYDEGEQEKKVYLNTFDQAKDLVSLEPDNSPIKERFNQYEAKLQAAVNGWNSDWTTSRQLLKDLSQDATIDIILNRNKKRQELISDQQRERSAHPNRIFDKDYSTVPLAEVDDTSTYKSYDLDVIADSVYRDRYSKLVAANRGDLPVDKEALLGQYLDSDIKSDPAKYNAIVNAVNLGLGQANAKYTQDKQQLDLQYDRLKKSRSTSAGTSNNNAGTPKSVDLGDGRYITWDSNKMMKLHYMDDNNKEVSVPVTDRAYINEYLNNVYTEDDLKNDTIRDTAEKTKMLLKLDVAQNGDFKPSNDGKTLTRIKTVEGSNNIEVSAVLSDGSYITKNLPKYITFTADSKVKQGKITNDDIRSIIQSNVDQQVIKLLNIGTDWYTARVGDDNRTIYLHLNEDKIK